MLRTVSSRTLYLTSISKIQTKSQKKQYQEISELRVQLLQRFQLYYFILNRQKLLVTVVKVAEQMVTSGGIFGVNRLNSSNWNGRSRRSRLRLGLSRSHGRKMKTLGKVQPSFILSRPLPLPISATDSYQR
jgi:hypothetical protein